MDIKIKSCLIILSVLLISCNNQNQESEVSGSEDNEILSKGKQEPIIEEMIIDTAKIIDQLQGKWKEIEYPYRTAEFASSTVKFLEEGTQSKAKFEIFELSDNCQFDNNNIRDLKSGDVILRLPENSRCEKLKVSNDTLTFSGFSTNSKEDYNIIYVKIKF